MLKLQVWMLTASLAAGTMVLTSVAAAKELPDQAETEAESTPQKPRTFNVMLTVPGGIAAEMKVVNAMAAGIYVEGSAAMNGRSKNSSTTDRTNVSTKSGGIQAHITPLGSAISDGLYIEPYLGYMKAKFSSSATSASTTGKGAVVGTEVGYGWFWRPGFNIQVGGGLRENALKVGDARYTGTDGSSKTLKTKGTVGFGLSGEAAFGWAF